MYDWSCCCVLEHESLSVEKNEVIFQHLVALKKPVSNPQHSTPSADRILGADLVVENTHTHPLRSRTLGKFKVRLREKKLPLFPVR